MDCGDCTGPSTCLSSVAARPSRNCLKFRPALNTVGESTRLDRPTIVLLAVCFLVGMSIHRFLVHLRFAHESILTLGNVSEVVSIFSPGTDSDVSLPGHGNPVRRASSSHGILCDDRGIAPCGRFGAPEPVRGRRLSVKPGPAFDRSRAGPVPLRDRLRGGAPHGPAQALETRSHRHA